MKAKLSMIRKYVLLLTIVGLCMTNGCQSVKQGSRFLKSEFRLRKVSGLKIGGVDVLSKKSVKELNLQEGLTLVSQIKQRRLVTDLTVDIQVKNPNDEVASLEGFQYVLVIDGKEILNDEIRETLQVGGNQQAIFSVTSRFDLVKAAKNTGYDTLLRLALGMVDSKQQPVKFDLYFRPYLRVLNKKVRYPDFIKLSRTYQSGRLK